MPLHQARTRRDPDDLPLSPPNLRPTQRTGGETPARPPPRLARLIHETSSRAASCSFHVHAPAASTRIANSGLHARGETITDRRGRGRILLGRFLLEVRQGYGADLPGEGGLGGRLACSRRTAALCACKQRAVASTSTQRDAVTRSNHD